MVTDEKPEVRTFNATEAQELIDTLDITTCSICGRPITAHNFGGADLTGAFCNDVLCALAFIDRLNDE